MPACRHSAAAQSAPARGLTWSLPENMVGSVRIAVARIQATGPSLARAASSSPMTTAHAPSEDGQVSSYRTGSQSMGEARTDSSVMSACCRCAYGLRLPLRRSLTATMRADVPGRAAAPDVGADVRGEVAARAGQHRHAERRGDRQRPHRVGLRLLLERDREHPPVPARLDQAGRHDPGRAADRARRVHPQQRLADGAQRVGQVQLGHHHALEQVRAPCRPRRRRCRPA